MGVENAVVERVAFGEDDGVLVVSVRPARQGRHRCGICRRWAPATTEGRGAVVGGRFDPAFAALMWVPLCPPSVAAGLGFHDSTDRSRRLHLLLDAYGYDGDRHAFGTAIVQRARRQVTVMREMAEAGDRAAIALLPVAGYIEQSASDVEAFPHDFWVR